MKISSKEIKEVSGTDSSTKPQTVGTLQTISVDPFQAGREIVTTFQIAKALPIIAVRKVSARTATGITVEGVPGGAIVLPVILPQTVASLKAVGDPSLGTLREDAPVMRFFSMPSFDHYCLSPPC